MRGPLKEQIQNAINRALKESIGGNNQAAYINVGGRRRNRKKKKAKKNNGVCGSAWSTLHFHVNEPPARCLVDIPPKAKGSSPQVTKAKKTCKETCKELKARLSPPRSCPKDALEADDKPLIGNEAAEDENEALQADQENIDPSNMPLSSLFKTTKARKSKKDKKGKGKDGPDTNATDDVTGQKEAQAQEQTPKAASPPASDVIVTPSSDDVKKTEQAGMEEKVEGAQERKENNVTRPNEQTPKAAWPPTSDVIVTPSSDDVKKTEQAGMEEKVEGAQERKENNVTNEQAQQVTANNSSDTKTDMTRDGGQDSPAILYTTDSHDVSLTLGEGPQLTQRPAEEGGGVVEAQPVAKAVDGSLPPETAPTGREKQGLLRDHNPEGMVCCTIL